MVSQNSWGNVLFAISLSAKTKKAKLTRGLVVMFGFVVDAALVMMQKCVVLYQINLDISISF